VASNQYAFNISEGEPKEEKTIHQSKEAMEVDQHTFQLEATSHHVFI
jgi:hypothetical protein